MKKNQIEIINLKSTIIEMKNLLKGFNRTFELSEAIISDLKEQPIEVLQFKEQKKIKK